MKTSGRWHICEMAVWDQSYFNIEVQAYIEINPDGTGEFQFGLVAGKLDGKLVKHGEGSRFEFSWNGCDENDPASGSGWLKAKDEDTIEGGFSFHFGDDSTFVARRFE